MYLAGLPPTMVYASTSLVTTLPAKTIAPSCIVTPGIINAFEKMKALSSIVTEAPFVSKCGLLILCPNV